MKFLVVEDAYEYNDEEYYQPEGDPYHIKSKLYDTKTEAQEVADRYNELNSYGEIYNEDTGEEEPIKPFRVEKIEE